MHSHGVVAELLGLRLSPARTGGLRFLRDAGTGDWTIGIPPIHSVPSSAAQVRAFALACREYLAAPPGSYDADLFAEGPDDGLLGFEIHPDGTVDVQLVMNLAGAVSLEGPGYPRADLDRLVGALLEATEDQ